MCAISAAILCDAIYQRNVIATINVKAVLFRVFHTHSLNPEIFSGFNVNPLPLINHPTRGGVGIHRKILQCDIFRVSGATIHDG